MTSSFIKGRTVYLDQIEGMKSFLERWHNFIFEYKQEGVNDLFVEIISCR